MPSLYHKGFSALGVCEFFEESLHLFQTLNWGFDIWKTCALTMHEGSHKKNTFKLHYRKCRIQLSRNSKSVWFNLCGIIWIIFSKYLFGRLPTQWKLNAKMHFIQHQMVSLMSKPSGRASPESRGAGAVWLAWTWAAQACRRQTGTEVGAQLQTRDHVSGSGLASLYEGRIVCFIQIMTATLDTSFCFNVVAVVFLH